MAIARQAGSVLADLRPLLGKLFPFGGPHSIRWRWLDIGSASVMSITRRNFLTRLGQSAAILGPVAVGWPSRGAKAGESTRFDVLVFGAGVAGLSTAHELARAGLKVGVVEKRAMVGGKARSVLDGEERFPGEHGFRFYAGFYHNLFGLMRQIPTPDGRTVFDRLVPINELLLATGDGNALLAPLNTLSGHITDDNQLDDSRRNLRNFFQWLDRLRDPMVTAEFGEPHEVDFFLRRMLYFATSGSQRRSALFEMMSWSDFLQAEKGTARYRNNLLQVTSTIYQAMKPEEGNANSVGATLLKIADSVARPGEVFMRMFDRPTQEAFLDPWMAYLQHLGVEFLLGHELTAVLHADGNIGAAQVREVASGRQIVLTATAFISAMPVDAFVNVAARSALASPTVDGAGTLKTDWMSGIQLFFEDYHDTHEIVACIGSPWALTFASEHEIWTTDLAGVGDGRARTLLSVIISDWDRQGYLGRRAKDCTREQILDEIFATLERHCGRAYLDETRATLHHVVFDPSLRFQAGKVAAFDDPLYINAPGDWTRRPGHAVAGFDNLFVAGSFVQTGMNIDCMEGASESGRRAAKAVLTPLGRGRDIHFRDYREFPILDPFRRRDDRYWFPRGIRHPFDQDMEDFL